MKKIKNQEILQKKRKIKVNSLALPLLNNGVYLFSIYLYGVHTDDKLKVHQYPFYIGNNRMVASLDNLGFHFPFCFTSYYNKVNQLNIFLMRCQRR